jgi:hypothetical protein
VVSRLRQQLPWLGSFYPPRPESDGVFETFDFHGDLRSRDIVIGSGHNAMEDHVVPHAHRKPVARRRYSWRGANPVHEASLERTTPPVEPPLVRFVCRDG